MNLKKNLIFNPIKIGIDLSTKKTGISLSTDNFQSNYLFTIENLGWSSDAWSDSLNNFKNKLIRFLIDFITQHNLNSVDVENRKIYVAIELIRSSDDNSQRFHFYAGMIYTLFNLSSFLKKNNWLIFIKFISPNEWFQFLLDEIGIDPNKILQYKRDERKKISLEFAKKITKKENITEDEADAFCINYLQHKCRCNSEVAIDVRNQKHFKNFEAKQKRQKIYKIQRRIDTLNKWIAACNIKYATKDKPKKTAIKFKSWLDEFEKLKGEFDELTKRKKQD